MLLHRRHEDDFDIELRHLLARRDVIDDEDDGGPAVRTERPARLGLMQTVTLLAAVAWLALGVLVVPGVVGTLLWLLGTPFAVAAVVFGLDLFLAGVDRARGRRRPTSAGTGEELSSERG